MEQIHGAERRITRSVAKKRKPLADLTNANAADGIRLDTASSCFRDEGWSRTCGAGGDDSVHWNAPSTPVRNSAEDGDGDGGGKLEMSVIYKRRKKEKKKLKKKELATAASCPPAARNRRSENGKGIMEDVNLPSKAYSVPYENRKKDKKFTLPPDLIEKQNAYFAEIDAHELLVEEVSESEVD